MTVERPKPVPLPTSLVVKNGSKMRSRSSGAIPAPVSLTESATYGPGLACEYGIKSPGFRVAVNAETSPDVLEYRSDHIPVFSKATGAMVDVPINRYSFDTITLLRQGVENVRLRLRSTPRTADSPFAPDADVYFINASLNEVDDPDERLALMKIPTTMYLTDPQIDRLLLAASRLIRNDPEFQRLMRDLQTSPEPPKN